MSKRTGNLFPPRGHLPSKIANRATVKTFELNISFWSSSCPESTYLQVYKARSIKITKNWPNPVDVKLHALQPIALSPTMTHMTKIAHVLTNHQSVSYKNSAYALDVIATMWVLLKRISVIVCQLHPHDCHVLCYSSLKSYVIGANDNQ